MADSVIAHDYATNTLKRFLNGKEIAIDATPIYVINTLYSDTGTIIISAADINANYGDVSTTIQGALNIIVDEIGRASVRTVNNVSPVAGNCTLTAADILYKTIGSISIESGLDTLATRVSDIERAQPTYCTSINGRNVSGNAVTVYASDISMDQSDTRTLTVAIPAMITEALAGFESLKFEVVDTYEELISKPEASISRGSIYLVPTPGSSPVTYTEYVYIKTDPDADGIFKILGTPAIDLSAYATTVWVGSQLQGYAQKSELLNYYTKTDIDSSFLTKSDAAAEYETKDDAANNNTSIAARLAALEVLEDVTRFQVYATSEKIYPGDVYYDADGNTHTDANGNTMTYGDNPYAVNEDWSVNANGMRQRTILRSTVPPAENDIRIDWGDGATDTAATLSSVLESNGEWTYTADHTYSAVWHYDVTIHGRDYFGIQHKSENTNQICRILDEGYPIASCVTSMTGLCTLAGKLVRINAAKGNRYFTNIHSVNEMFTGCWNLREVKGLGQYAWQYLITANKMFYNCVNLLTCDFRMPPIMLSASGYQSMYENCGSLISDISTLLPATGFGTTHVDLSSTFKGCAALTGTLPANKLWECSAVAWSATDCVTGCSTAMRAQAPQAWGGTMIIPENALTLEELNTRLIALEDKLYGIDTALTSIVGE